MALPSIMETKAEQLFQATEKNDVMTIKTLLAQNPVLIRSKNSYGYTPLIIAAKNSNFQLVKLFVEELLADINAEGDEHFPLRAAAIANNKEICEYLLKKGAKVDACSKGNRTALHAAVRNENIELIKLLLQYKARTDIINDFQESSKSIVENSKNIEIKKLFTD
eukprot:snap_masked-scaffold_52-processed-gene-1.67-mRNA-1 protein AED:0.23 eAED:0.23 QI:0/-1/0/1/-1/1/1/0/164